MQHSDLAHAPVMTRAAHRQMCPSACIFCTTSCGQLLSCETSYGMCRVQVGFVISQRGG